VKKFPDTLTVDRQLKNTLRQLRRILMKGECHT